MPCSDGGLSVEQEREEEGIKASWCAILTVLEAKGLLSGVLDLCNWDAAGVTREEMLGWWSAHKRQDAERRKYEREQLRRQALRQRALAKLTPEEREAL